MEYITALLVLSVFVLAIVAFVALSRTTRLTQSVELCHDMIADLMGKVANLSHRLSLLDGKKHPASRPQPPPIVPARRPDPIAQPLAPEPQPLEELPETVAVLPEIVEPVAPDTEPELVLEPLATPPPAPPRPIPVVKVHQPEAGKTDWTNFESAAGKRWLTWVGVVILFLSASFFLKYAFDMKWIGPNVQVLLAVVGGIALLAMGEYFQRQDMRPLGCGLIGGGIMVLYAALFAAYRPGLVYDTPVIKSQELTFALMCVVTIAGMAMAVRHDAISISFLAILGGMLTPVLLSKGIDARDALFAYILLLDLGVLGVAFYKKWRALDILAFVGTIALFWGWWSQFGVGAPVGPPLAWLAAFWAVFAIVPAVHHFRRRTELTVERLVISLVNATWGFALAYQILADRPNDLAWVAMVMSGAYLTLGVLVRLRCKDAKAMFGFISLAMMFLTLFAPLRFELNGITLAWLAEAVVLVYLGFLFDYRPVRIGGFITLLLGSGRVFLIHYPVAAWAGWQLAAFVNTNFWTMMCAPIAGGLVAIVHQVYRRKSEPEDRQIQIICTIGSGLLALVLLSLELDRWFWTLDNIPGPYLQYLHNCSIAVLWAIGTLAFIGGAKLSSTPGPLRSAALVPLGGAALLIAHTFTLNSGAEHMLFINPQFAAAFFICGVMWIHSLTWPDEQSRIGFSIASSYATIGLLCAEVLLWVWRMAPQWQVDRIYTTWWTAAMLLSLCAAVYLAIGKLRGSVEACTAGLAPLLIAWICVLRTHFINPQGDMMMFLNARFIAAIMTLGVMLAWPMVMRSDRRISTRPSDAIAPLYVWFTISLLALLTVEPAAWFHRNLADPRQAKLTAQMSISIVWGLYASGMLSIGFWKRIMPLRLAALALFGLTAVKLLVVDMADARQIYRIISFFVMGLLMVAASYLYHIIEKRLKKSEAPDSGPQDGSVNT